MRAPAAIAAIGLALACSSHRDADEVGLARAAEPTPIPARPPAATPPETQPSPLGTDLSPDEVLSHLAADEPTTLVPVGTTNVVFHAALDGPIDAAWKVRSRIAQRGPEAEVAAYRIARLLGLDDVPPATLRRVSRAVLHDRLAPELASSWSEIEAWTIWNDDDTTTCAAILWVPDLRASTLESPSEARRLDRALASAGDGAELTQRHSDYAVMLAFDYLIANPDRWNGRNLAEVPAGDRLVLRDHDAAFAVPLPAERHRRLARDLSRARRLPQRFVQRLAAVSPEQLRLELTRNGDGRPLLGEAEIAGVLDRRRALLAHASALADELGPARAFALP